MSKKNLSPFKPGDTVLCTVSQSGTFTPGKIYVVSDYIGNWPEDFTYVTQDDYGSTTNGTRHSFFKKIDPSRVEKIVWRIP
jgi:hypothetical protein